MGGSRHVIASFVQRIYQVVREAVFPTQCLGCGGFFRPLDGGGPDWPADTDLTHPMAVPGLLWLNRLLSPFLCSDCNQGFTVIESPMCICCGTPFKARVGEDHLCGDCILSPKAYRMARALLVYHQSILNLIHCYKYKGKIQLAEPLGSILLTAFHHFWESQRVDVVVPVPLHSSRFRNRGFNQVFLLMRSWQKRAKADALDLSAVQIEHNVLLRSANTAPQTNLGREERLTNIQNAFTIRMHQKIKDKAVLLVDDVYTTGATVNECARILLKGGAKHVDVLTLARAV